MILKLLSSILVFAEVGVFAFMPYVYPRIHSSKIVMTLVSCFSSGLFLGLALLHVLPESNQMIEESFSKHHQHSEHSHEHSLPYGSVVAIITFVLILGIETYFHSDNQQGHSHSHSHSHNHDHYHNDSASELFFDLDFESLEYELIRDKQKKKQTVFQHNSKVLLTQFALSIHSFFQCMSLGVQISDAAVLTLLVGILVHKWAQGLTLGYAYKAVNMPRETAQRYAIFHATLNGSAVLIGWRLSSINNFVAGVLSSISAGTFLYVCMVEKIQHQFVSKQDLFRKILAVLTGVFFVCLIT